MHGKKDIWGKEKTDDAHVKRVGEATQCLKRFFHGKPYYKPTPDNKIPIDVLISPTNINILLTTQDINIAMDLIEDEIEAKNVAGQPLAKSGYMTPEKEKELYLNIIKEFRELEICYDFQAGMLLLYFWLCEGVEF